MQIKILGVMLLVGGAAFGVSEADKAMNYEKIQGEVIEVVYDCSIEKGKRKIVNKSTDKTAYMDCDDAPEIAEQFGYPESAIKRRA